MTTTETHSEYEYSKEILDYDGYVLSVEYEDHYMLMNDDDVQNHDVIEEGKTVHFNVDDGFVSDAIVEETV